MVLNEDGEPLSLAEGEDMYLSEDDMYLSESYDVGYYEPGFGQA
jgi:hypothetical protein